MIQAVTNYTHNLH